MVREEHEGLPQLPCSRGEVDGLQSRKRISVATSFRRTQFIAGIDDLFPVQATLLLSLWVEASGGQSIRTFLETGRSMLLPAI